MKPIKINLVHFCSKRPLVPERERLCVCAMEWMTVAKSSLDELHYIHAVLLLALAPVAAAFILYNIYILGRTKQWPPGPPAWPIIGHLHLLGQLPHHSLCRLSQSYGPLLGLRLGGVPTIVVSSPQLAKEDLQTHDLAFASRPSSAAAVHLYSNGTDMGFAPYGPYWKFMRQLCKSELFTPKRLESFRHVREEEVRELVLQIGRRGDEEVEILQHLLATTNNIICRMAMGKRITEIDAARRHEDSNQLDLLSLIKEVDELSGVFYVGDFVPWLAWLDPYGYLKRMKATGQRAKALLQDVIDKRRSESPQENEQSDLLGVLLAASQNKDHDIQITDDNMVAIILDVFLGGSDTSAVTVEWALADLINNPKVMQKVQEELDNVVGRERRVTEGDVPNLRYLGSVLKESMRLHPLVPLLAPHEAIQECYIGGFKIPAKTRVHVNTWAIGRDGATWERPLEFCPERFYSKNIDLRGQNFELLPFGSGRRKCPGWALGLLNVHLMLATLVQSFTWSIEPLNNPSVGNHTRILDMTERFGLIVSMAKPLCAFATPRLPITIY